MSAPLLGLFAALFTGLALLGAIAPFLGRRRAPQLLAEGNGDDRNTVLRALRDLEVDRARGALDEGDYRTLRARLEVEAVGLLRPAVHAVPKRRPAAAPLTPTRRARLTPARPAWLAGTIIAGVVVAGSIAVLAGSVSNRAPGGFITGSSTGSNAAAPDPAALVRRDPNDIDARLNLAQQDLQNNQAADATAQYLAVLKLDPKNPEARTRLALLLYESGNTETSLEALDKVLADDPRYPEALFIKGVVLLNGLNRPADAVAPLRAYLEVDPSGPYAWDAHQLLSQASAPPRGSPAP